MPSSCHTVINNRVVSGLLIDGERDPAPGSGTGPGNGRLSTWSSKQGYISRAVTELCGVS